MKRLFSKFKCNTLDWHKPDNIQYYEKNDIFLVNLLSHCKYCGRLICRDGQGNWYAFGEKKSYRERYKRIGESENFKKHYEDKSLGECQNIE